jgi:citrate synthase
MSSKVYDQASDLISKNKIPNRHTFYQLKHFVLGKEVTTQAKLQKCLRELDARRSALRSMIIGIEESKDDLRMLELKTMELEKKKTKNELHREYKLIQARKLLRKRDALAENIREMEKKLNETEEEMSFFLAAFQQLEQVEPLKRHDDPESNAEFWNENFAQELQLRMLLQKPLDLELVKCILAMHKDSPIRKEMIGILDQIQSQAIEAKQSKIGAK